MRSYVNRQTTNKKQKTNKQKKKNPELFSGEETQRGFLEEALIRKKTPRSLLGHPGSLWSPLFMSYPAHFPAAQALLRHIK